MRLAIRRKNLTLARALYGGSLENLSNAVGSLISTSMLSRLPTGDSEISLTLARRIKQKLGLPEFWLDRDNHALLKMDSTNCQVHAQTTQLPDDKKQHLIALLTPAKS
jgi:plasmid maintenance system antidote protein VapI